jgi:hypothetical protein
VALRSRATRFRSALSRAEVSYGSSISRRKRREQGRVAKRKQISKTFDEFRESCIPIARASNNAHADQSEQSFRASRVGTRAAPS